MADAASWIVTTGETTHEVLADQWRKEKERPADGDTRDDEVAYRPTVLRLYRSGEVVAEFSHWSSIVRRDEQGGS